MPETLNFEPAINHPELVSPTITETLKNWKGNTAVEEILVAEIDPTYLKGEDLCNHYGIPFSEGANCVIIEAVCGDKKIYAACLAPVNTRISFNSTVRKQLDSRRVSLAPLDYVLEQTKMEYGSITPVGLPGSWPILIDAKVASLPRVIVGGGLKKSKLSLPGKALTELPNAIVVEGLAS